VPYAQRVLVGAVVVSIGAIVLRFLWRVRFGILKAVRKAPPYARSLACGGILLVASVGLDGLARTFHMFGTSMSGSAHVVAGIAEETTELGIALALLVALLQVRFDPLRNTLYGR
jgi:hypothetical protein